MGSVLLVGWVVFVRRVVFPRGQQGGARGSDGPDALVVFGLDESERVEAARLGIGRGLAVQPAAPARSVAHSVEGHGVADETILDEGARGGRIIAGIEAQLHLAADELGADLQKAAAEAYGAVLAHEAALA